MRSFGRVIFWILVGTSVLIGLACFGVGLKYSVDVFTDADNLGRPNEIGDFWGGTIGASAAVAGTFLFFATLLLQTRELALQREEITRANLIHEEQKEALEDQVNVAKSQSALTQIFTLLERSEIAWENIDRKDSKALRVLDEITSEVEKASGSFRQQNPEAMREFMTRSMRVRASLGRVFENRLIAEELLKETRLSNDRQQGIRILFDHAADSHDKIATILTEHDNVLKRARPVLEAYDSASEE